MPGFSSLESINTLNSRKVVVFGLGSHERDGKLIPISLKEGDTVIFPAYGGSEIKLGDKEL